MSDNNMSDLEATPITDNAIEFMCHVPGIDPEVCKQLERENNRLKSNYESACKLVADMHYAATSRIGAPNIGVVEDVKNLREERDQLKAEVERLNNVIMGVQENLEESNRMSSDLKNAETKIFDLEVKLDQWRECFELLYQAIEKNDIMSYVTFNKSTVAKAIQLYKQLTSGQPFKSRWEDVADKLAIELSTNIQMCYQSQKKIDASKVSEALKEYNEMKKGKG